MSPERRAVLSSVVGSEADIFARYGGVVPEIASRAHTEAISRLTREALTRAGVGREEVDAIAVTDRPGLIGALLVGVNFAKSLAYAWHKPLIPVDHIAGHIAACTLSSPDLEPPFFAFVASGGHCELMLCESFTSSRTVGRTRDDAIGECFDKAARVIGLPYPGGREMDRLASRGDPNAIRFPSAAIAGVGEDGLPTLDFSFSGLKTAALNFAHTKAQRGESFSREDFAASFTAAILRSVHRRLIECHDRFAFKALVVGGGVAANSHLRKMFLEFGRERGVRVYLPEARFCGDNAAMIGAQGYFDYLAGHTAPLSLNPRARRE